MNIAICDDDLSAAQQLHDYINELRQDHSVQIYSSTVTLLADYKSGKRYDLVFMDIQMDVLNGVQAAEILHKEFYSEKPLIVFFTKTDKYLNSAHRYAWWYIRKPISKEELFELIEHARQDLEDYNIFVDTTKGIYNIRAKDIIYIEAYYGKAKIYTTRQEYTTKMTLAAVAQLLPERLFFQSHRSYYINLGHVAGYDRAIIMLTDNSEAHLSRDRSQAFVDKLTEYVNSKKNARIELNDLSFASPQMEEETLTAKSATVQS